jgi:hypothetical protein
MRRYGRSRRRRGPTNRKESQLRAAWSVCDIPPGLVSGGNVNCRLRDEHAPEAVHLHTTAEPEGLAATQRTQRGLLGNLWANEASIAEEQSHNEEGRNAFRQCDPTTTERGGFEPPVPFWGTRPFQGRSFSHSDTSPGG